MTGPFQGLTLSVAVVLVVFVTSVLAFNPTPILKFQTPNHLLAPQWGSPVCKSRPFHPRRTAPAISMENSPAAGLFPCMLTTEPSVKQC